MNLEGLGHDSVTLREHISLEPYQLGYAAFMEALLSGNENDYRNFLKGSQQIILKLHAGEDGGGYKHYTISALYLMNSFLDLYQGHPARSVLNLMRSRNYWRVNQKMYPGFPKARLSGGILEWVLGNIPPGYQFFFKLAGLKGNSDQGIAMLQDYHGSLVPGSFDHLEFILIIGHLKSLLPPGENPAWPALQEYIPAYGGIALFDFTLIRQLEPLPDFLMDSLCTRLIRTGPPIIRPLVHYHYGIFLMNRLDPTASGHLEHFLEQARGKHFKNAARLYLAWGAFLQEKYTMYGRWIDQLDAGNTFLEPDHQALQESLFIPEPRLLAARLLYDGGYYKRAMDSLDLLFPFPDSLNHTYRAEYYYRRGRVQQALSNREAALDSFRKVLNYSHVRRYFKANAALQAGIISLDRNESAQARDYFKKALVLDQGGYQSIKLRARRHLERLSAD